MTGLISLSHSLQEYKRFHMQIMIFNMRIKFGDSNTRKKNSEISMVLTNLTLLKNLSNPKFQAR